MDKESQVYFFRMIDTEIGDGAVETSEVSKDTHRRKGEIGLYLMSSVFYFFSSVLLRSFDLEPIQ